MEICVVGLIGLVVLLYLATRRPHKFPPGPAGLPLLGYAPFLRLPIFKCFQEISKTYNKIWGFYIFNIPIVVLNDWKLLKQAYSDDRLIGKALPSLFDNILGDGKGINGVEGKTWHEQRRFVNKQLRTFAFTKTSLENLTQNEIIAMRSEFRKKLNDPVSLEADFYLAAMRILWIPLAGERFFQYDRKAMELLRTAGTELDKQQFGVPISFPHWLQKFIPSKYSGKSFMDCLGHIDGFLKQIIKDHIDRLDIHNDQQNLIDAYLREIYATSDPKSSFWKTEGEEQLLGLLLELFFAGGGSTSSTLSWAFLYLITEPEVQRKAQKEIDSIVGSDRLPSLSDRPRMPYTEALIAEILRKSSLAPFTLHSAMETANFDDYILPKGTIVFGNLWELHNDKEYWGDPENFRPERYINDDGVFRKDVGLNPFSVGKRVCIAENAVPDQLFLVISGLLQQFSFETDLNSPPSTDPVAYFFQRTQAYNIVIREKNATIGNSLI